jgi:hypothetical protein
VFGLLTSSQSHKHPLSRFEEADEISRLGGPLHLFWECVVYEPELMAIDSEPFGDPLDVARVIFRRYGAKSSSNPNECTHVFVEDHHPHLKQLKAVAKRFVIVSIFFSSGQALRLFLSPNFDEDSVDICREGLQIVNTSWLHECIAEDKVLDPPVPLQTCWK